MTAINPAPQTTQPASMQQEKKPQLGYKNAMYLASTPGFIADMYLSASKAVPKRYIKRIDGITEKLPKNAPEPLTKVLKASKKRLLEIVKDVNKDYGFFNRFILFSNEIRNDAEEALTPLTRIDAEKLPKEIQKPVKKLAKIGKNAVENIDGFGKQILVAFGKQLKFSIIGAGVGLVGMLGYKAIKGLNNKKQA